MFNVLLKKVARQEGIVVGSKTCRLICIVTRFVRFVEISVERKRKKKKERKRTIGPRPVLTESHPFHHSFVWFARLARVPKSIRQSPPCRFPIFLRALDSRRSIFLLPPSSYSPPPPMAYLSSTLLALVRSTRGIGLMRGERGRREGVESGGELEKSREQWIR